MFDPVSNPFAIQNLLDRSAPPFNVAQDERPAAGFGIDPLAGGSMIKAFEVDRRLQLPDEDFAADAAASGEFVTEDAMSHTGFEAEAQSEIDAAFTGSADDADHAAEAADAEPEEPAIEAAQAEVMTMPAPEPEPVQAPQPDFSSEAVMQQIEAARAEAHAQGLDAGRAEGRAAERPLAHQQGYDEGYAAGIAHAKAESKAVEQKRQQQEHQAKLDQLQALIDNLQQLAYNPDAMFEPMKKLTVHLAEQLVRGELTQSPQAISRLVDNALRELNVSGDKAVIIHLNPEDLDAYRPTVASFGDSLILRPDTQLERGSVRVSLDGSVVEDLMQRRVDGLRKSMAQAPAPNWRAGGGSLASRVQQGQPVDDVTIVDQNNKTDSTLEAAAPADGHA